MGVSTVNKNKEPDIHFFKIKLFEYQKSHKINAEQNSKVPVKADVEPPTAVPSNKPDETRTG